MGSTSGVPGALDGLDGPARIWGCDEASQVGAADAASRSSGSSAAGVSGCANGSCGPSAPERLAGAGSATRWPVAIGVRAHGLGGRGAAAKALVKLDPGQQLVRPRHAVKGDPDLAPGAAERQVFGHARIPKEALHAGVRACGELDEESASGDARGEDAAEGVARAINPRNVAPVEAERVGQTARRESIWSPRCTFGGGVPCAGRAGRRRSRW